MTTTDIQAQTAPPGSDEWLDQKTAESEVPATETKPETPAVETQPTETVEPWWEKGFAEAKHGFLKNRKGPEVEQAFRATEAEMRKSWQAKDAAETRARQAEADAAALRLAMQQREAQQQTPPVDHAKEVEQIFYEQGPAAAFARQQELNDARIAAEAQKIANQTVQQFQQTTSDQARQQSQAMRLKAALDAGATARATLNVDPSVWDSERGLVVSARVLNKFGQDGLMDVKNWTDEYAALYPSTAAAQPQPVVAPAPAVTNPPGSHRAAPVQQKPNAGLPTMDGEERRALELLAEAGGVDPEKLKARHLANARRANG
jgi:hypothetical protein